MGERCGSELLPAMLHLLLPAVQHAQAAARQQAAIGGAAADGTGAGAADAAAAAADAMFSILARLTYLMTSQGELAVAAVGLCARNPRCWHQCNCMFPTLPDIQHKPASCCWFV